MVGPSKILTVSYGTFSCTLEGFDDPFATMRGIAEYFRDLAADDRYFGAEPPTPDAEMLHRIAEREVHRRVEARVENNGVVLRQMNDKADAPSAKRSASAAAAAAAAASDSEAEQETEDAEPGAGNFTTAEESSVRLEGIAEKLARLRAAAARRENDAIEAEEEDSGAGESPAQAGIVGAFDTPAAEDAPAASIEPETLEAEFDRADEDEAWDDITETEAYVGDEEPDVFVAEVTVTTIETVVADEIEDIAGFGTGDMAAAEPQAAEPAAIAPSDEVEAEDAFEEEHTPFPFAEDELTADEAASPAGAAVQNVHEDEDTAIFLAEEELPEDDAEDLSEIASEDDEATFALAEEQVTGEEAESPTEVASEDYEDYDEDEYEAEPVRTADAQWQDDSAEAPETLILGQSDLDHAADADDEDMQAEEPVEDEADAPAIARIYKMRRADLEDAAESATEDQPEEPAAAAETFTEEQYEDDDADDDYDYLSSDAVAEETAEDETEEELAENVFGEADEPEAEDLSDAEEAELMATLAQVRRDSEAESRAEKEGRAVLERQDLDGNGNGVKRLLDVTNTELEETEGSRRRSAIQHLKAAVLATRADRSRSKAEPTEESDETINQYREDLAQVVRPRRPADGVKPTERRQSPLILVSEQRVDIVRDEAGTGAEAAPVRPRRVAATQPETDEADGTSDDDSGTGVFADAEAVAEFVEKMGASALPNLVEALAAYASYVEGQPHFSRPQIMRAIAAYYGEDFSREDSLRAFGQLLRTGNIQKLNRGQFAVSQSTRYNPGARAAGE